ncbi:hypothetical protein GOP47_0025873 [Adiantum capillus-veneris]|uniref:Uncharacterized protein n=1 Tax=Adiantum capillus-veneris TaxID=13818 RepID=A0A9D4U130_ADICA|nr:hypothetical protein GOP47_0025873 [Adiantum capillus-veneris]
MDTIYNTENAKNRIDTLKKMYKKEKQNRLPLADGSAKENEDILNELEQEVGTNSGVSASTSQNPISSMDFIELEGVSGSKAK